MNAAQLLAELGRLGVELRAEGDKLHYSAPRGALTLELRAELVDLKKEICELLNAVRSADSPGSTSIVPVSREGELPLSFGQERFWFLDQLEPDNGLYQINLALRLVGPLDAAVLEQSFQQLVSRHEALRSSCATVAGRPVLTIVDNPRFEMPVVDLSSQPASQREPEARDVVNKEARRLLPLTQAPLLRAVLIRLSDDEHVLFLATHHFAIDGWSLRLFVRELAECYTAGVNGTEPSLPERELEYVDITQWERQRHSGETLRQELEHWKQRLAGAPATLDLPTDRPRAAVQTYQGGAEPFALSESLTNRLRDLSRQEETTLFMTLLAAFQAILSRHANQADVVVATAASLRNCIQAENLVGTFANNLLLRTDLSGDPTFRELLARVRDVTLDAFAHQDVPFETILNELRLHRDLSRNTLFQTAFVLHQDTLENNLRLPGVQVGRFPIDHHLSRFDLSLDMVNGRRSLAGTFEYNTDLFRRSTIQRIAGHYQVLLEAVAADPDLRLSRLPLLTDFERRTLLVDWSRAPSSDFTFESVPRSFEAQVQRTPDRVAAVCGEERVTYRELNERANRLAHYLRKRGVGPETRVGLCLDRSSEMLVAVLAVFKAGGAYVPLEPEFPAHRLTFMLEDSGAALLVTQSNLARELAEQPLETIFVDTDRSAIAQESAENLPNEVLPTHLAYVIYTSGSTGKPKGVQIEHAALSNFLESMRREPGMTEDDVMLAETTLSFDIATLELMLPILVGARVVLVDRKTAADGYRLLEQLDKHQVTKMQATPATWRMLLQAGPLPDRLVALCGGEPLSPVLATTLLRQVSQLWNLYGPTETTVWSTVQRVGPPLADSLASGHQRSYVDAQTKLEAEGAGSARSVVQPRGSIEPVLIGRPIANTDVYVLDEHLQSVPIGVTGELYIGGRGVARGYLNRPELTAEKFIPHPFSDDPNARLYRTGDLARWHFDGRLECLGRVDYQVKIRGFRIELGEIESVLARHEQVRECVVDARDDTPHRGFRSQAGINDPMPIGTRDLQRQAQTGDAGSGGKRLVAYVVPEGELSPEIGELRGWLASDLPEYMIPTAFVMLETLPLLPSGKIDRRALPEPDASRPKLDRAYAPPESPVQKLLAEIWAEVLGLERVGIHDNFFELGGHSLIATQASSRIESAFEIEFPLRSLFEAPTVSELAVVVIDRFSKTEHRGFSSEPQREDAEQSHAVDALAAGHH